MLILFALQAAACLTNGATHVTLTGTIHVATAAGDPAHGKPAYRYASLALDNPACIRIADGTTTKARTAEIVEHRPNLTLPFRFKHRHVSVTAARVTLAHAAPIPLMLEDPTIEPDQD
ncbi:MAG: hypothetical protein ACTHM8_00430 [Sphingomonas sp.]